MKFPQIEEEEIISVIGKMKNGKATGVDGISAELMKLLIKDEDVRKNMVKCFNNVLKEKVHEDWLISKTTRVPKIKRPTILDHRPIAVTVNSSKIICTILRKKIEEYLKEKNIVFENQYGFTSGGKKEHCLFIIDYITNMTYESSRNKSLFFAFIDFKKGI